MNGPGDTGGAPPDPTELMRLATGYWESQTFLTANRIGLFDVLAEGPLDAPAVARALETDGRATELFLKACVGLGLLQREEEKFANSAATATFMTRGARTYLGDAFRYSDNLYATWGELEQALGDGKPRMLPETYLGEDDGKTRDFAYAMHNRALGIGMALTSIVDMAGRRRLADIGGGPGTYAALFCRQHPELRATVMDLPPIARHAEEIVASMGVGDRVSIAPGDYHHTEFPAGSDAVLISGVFHRETEADCQSLIEKAYDSLGPDGLLIVSDVFTDAGGDAPAFATLFGLNMMLTAPNGTVHSDASVAEWLRHAGFSSISTTPFPPPMPHRVVTGRKP